jgi:hypothetical protein
MNPSDKCRVDDCDAHVAASVIRDTLPGPLRLCALHTEDFRMNSAGWMVSWEQRMAEPTSVKAAPAAPVGRMPLGLVDSPDSGSSSETSLRRGVAHIWRSAFRR